jgi:putative restriction endonuclease
VSPRVNWSHEDHILAFNLYCKIPFGQIHHVNPRIIDLARLLGRTAGSVALKLSNFARLDPELRSRGIVGMSHGAKGEETVWNEFYRHPDDLAFESERLLAQRQGVSIEELAGISVDGLPREGREREAVVRIRVNQQFFRAAVLSAYDFRCCVTGLSVPEFLNASHILSWACSPEHRVDPRNGLCLNVLHDRAFDRGLMFIGDRNEVHFSDELRSKPANKSEDRALEWILSFEGRNISVPRRFRPDPRFLRQHRARCRT